MKLNITTSSYNERRYSSPWIARVDFSTNVQGEFQWGDWIGDKGSGGLLELDCEPGDIVARGQKDNSKPRNSAPDWYCAIELQGKSILRPIGGKADALKLFRMGREAAAARVTADRISELEETIRTAKTRIEAGFQPGAFPPEDSVRAELAKAESILAKYQPQATA